MKEILLELNRRTCEFPMLQILRERDVAHQDEIDAEVARMFGQNGVAPLVKAKVHQEVNFALSRLFALHLVSRYGDGLASINDEGRTITPDRLAKMTKCSVLAALIAPFGVALGMLRRI